jgi:hypothetical protein
MTVGAHTYGVWVLYLRKQGALFSIQVPLHHWIFGTGYMNDLRKDQNLTIPAKEHSYKEE